MLKETRDEFVSPDGIDINRRRALGIYYTPRSAATVLAKWAIRSKEDTVLEPSFGGCTILEAALEELSLLGSSDPAKQLFGFDIDESAFAHLGRLLGRKRNPHFLLRDFLKVTPNRLAVTTVIANPPFVSYHRMDKAQREVVHAWRARYVPCFPMTASLWAYFLMHSLAFLKESGRLAFILPSASTSSDYAQPLMRMLESRFLDITVCHMNEQLFIQAGAEERTVVVLAEGYLTKDIGAARRKEYSAGSVAELQKFLWKSEKAETLTGAPKRIAVRRNTPIVLVDRILKRATNDGLLCTLGETVDVTIGEVVGDSKFLVRPSFEWDALGISKHHLRPIVTRMRQLGGLQVTQRDVSALYTSLPYLITPPIRRVPKRIEKFLGLYPQKKRSENKTFAKREPWYQVTYDSSAPAFIGSLSHRSPKIVLNSAGISCANGLYKLTPKKNMVWHSWIAAASLTTIFQLSAEMRARVRGSGALKLEPSDVKGLLVPKRATALTHSVCSALSSHLDKLLRGGEYESATRIADDVLLIQPGIVTSAELNSIRDRLQDVRGERLASKT